MCTYTPNGAVHSRRPRSGRDPCGIRTSRPDRGWQDPAQMRRVAATTAAVSTRRTVSPSDTRSAASAELGRRPAAFGTDGHRAVVRLRAAGRPARRRQPAPRTSAAGTGPASSGSHTRRDCSAASTAMRRSRSSWRSARSPSQRTTERSACTSTSRSTPISVHFCTSHSRRSPFGGATAIVIGDAAARPPRRRRRSTSTSSAGHRTRPPPAGAVGHRHDLAVAEPQHAAEVVRRRVVEHRRGDVGDQHVGRRPPQHLVHGAPTRTPT